MMLAKAGWLLMLGMMVPILLLGQSPKDVVPDKVVTSVILSGESDYTYYALSTKNTTQITVTGPGELTVYARVRVPEDVKRSSALHLKYIMDGHSVSTYQVRALDVSSKIKYKGKLIGKPTKAGKQTITVAPGKHRIAFFKTKKSQAVHAKFRFKQFNKPVWKDMKPEKGLEQVGLKYNNGKLSPTYSRINNEDEFRFSVSDTARIRILVRDEFTYKMLSENYLRVIISRNSEEPKSYKFLTSRARNISYTSMNKLVPSYLKSLYLDIPKPADNWHYTIKLKGAGKSAIVRVSYDTNLLGTQ